MVINLFMNRNSIYAELMKNGLLRFKSALIIVNLHGKTVCLVVLMLHIQMKLFVSIITVVVMTTADRAWQEQLMSEYPMGCQDNDISNYAACNTAGDDYGRCMLYGDEVGTDSKVLNNRGLCEAQANHVWVSDYWGWQPRSKDFASLKTAGICHRSFVSNTSDTTFTTLDSANCTDLDGQGTHNSSGSERCPQLATMTSQ